MKANELTSKDLMDGDWVQMNNGPAIVIKERDILFKDKFGKGIAPICNPIPLTPEILEKNGWKHEFDKKDYMVKYNLGEEGKNCWMMWAIKEHNLDIQRQDENLDVYNLKVSKVAIPCDYVHQLQHALRLCGITREIIL